VYKKRRFSTWIVVIVLLVIGSSLIWFDNPIIRLPTQQKKLIASLTLFGICFGWLLCDDLFLRILKSVVSSEYFRALNIRLINHSNSKIKNQVSETSYVVQMKKLRVALHMNYGRFWPHRIRIILLTGSNNDVELLAPGLADQLWQEDRGTLLLWGGEPSAPLDAEWTEALSKLRRRPIDGVVWVTSAFAQKLPPSNDMIERMSQALTSRCGLSGWRFPLYVWSLHGTESTDDVRTTQAVGCLLSVNCKPEVLRNQLAALVPSLIEQGTQQISNCPKHQFLLQLAGQLANDPDYLAEPLGALLTPWQPLPLAGIMFSPAYINTTRAVRHHWVRDNRWDILLESLPSLPAGLVAKKRGVAWGQVMMFILTGAMVLWGAGMVTSFLVNRGNIISAASQVRRAAAEQQPLPVRLQAQLDLQHTLDQLTYRQQHGAPWFSRAGLNQNDALLKALWPHYGASALPLVRDAAARHLEAQLNALLTLSPDNPQRESLMKPAYDQLKLWLMLVYPEKMDAAWFSKTLLKNWQQRKGIPDRLWQGSGPALLDFYARHLPSHPSWRLDPNTQQVSQVRTLLVRQMGARNSDASLYQKMLVQVANQYADMRLSDMTGDTDAARLFTTDEVVPGMFTRKAWEETVRPTIERIVSERSEEMDWVLSDNRTNALQQASPDALQASLEARYFADFSASWLAFLNSLRLRPARTLSDSIDQLTLIADVRQSPLVALMNTLSVQGKTGQLTGALPDSLVKSAKDLLNRDEKPAFDQQTGVQGPLDSTFGPVLALMASGDSMTLSLKTFLTRVTQVRLKLQQVVNAPDPQAMSRTLAQTVFQGKAVDLTETRDYGSLVAASLGQEWNGFGQTVFVQPVVQAWQQVLTPAAESLNTQWQAAIVNDWNSTFGGRYPLKNTSSEVSLPLLARYLNNDSGRIAHFLQTRLSGVLHKEGSHWVPDSISAQGLTFNPAFLDAVDMLSTLSDVAFAGGEAGIRFELRPGTAKDVMQTDLIIDSQKLSYYNQSPFWKRFSWPHDTESPGASLSWISTQAGTRQYADLPGSWGLIRLLEKAEVTPYPGVNSSFSVTWKAPDGRPLHYTLRTEAGEGPLALLKLRDFRLPEQIFSVNRPGTEDVN
jgi:type VI secretion system protein ImpL